MAQDIENSPIDFIDFPSINVLGRAALETFLVFHHVFFDPVPRNERDCRYLSWKIGGFLDRQRFPVKSTKGAETLAKEAKFIADLRKKLEANEFFSSLTPKQQKKIINKGRWKFKSWTDMALAAGLSKDIADAFYSYLCGYAHASSLCILQVNQSGSAQIQSELSSATKNLVMVATALMATFYIELFPISRAILENDPEKAMTVKLWSEVGSYSWNDK